MSNTRKQQPEKISADCPHCGYSQLESAYAKSTICKRCSQHFSIEKLLAKEVGSLKPPSLFEKLGKLISREGMREIHCFSCQAVQQVSTAAESSLCPKCGSYIDLRDFRISGPFGRTVQTQGRVTILAKGDVTTRILCGYGRIEGKMRGQMISGGLIELNLAGRISGDLQAEKLIVERKSDVEFGRPVKAKAFEIDGRVSGTLICDGRVTIHKHGVVTGAVYARSIVVEKGGIFSGELNIHAPRQNEEFSAELTARVAEAPAASGGAQPAVAEEGAAAPAEGAASPAPEGAPQGELPLLEGEQAAMQKEKDKRKPRVGVKPRRFASR